MSRRRVGVFGGSFNPPHVAHLAVAEAVAEAAALDRVLVDARRDAAAQARRPVTRPRRPTAWRWCGWPRPATRASTSPTSRSPAPASRTPSTRSDALRDGRSRGGARARARRRQPRRPPTWRDPARSSACPRLAYARPGTSRGADRPLPALAGRLSWVDAPALALSSTDLRARIAAGQSVRYLVPDAVRDYVDAHGLYGAGATRGRLARRGATLLRRSRCGRSAPRRRRLLVARLGNNLPPPSRRPRRPTGRALLDRLPFAGLILFNGRWPDTRDTLAACRRSATAACS